MLQFDPLVFLLETALFLCGIVLMDRLLFSQIYALLEKRRHRLNTENGHAENARRLLTELKEKRRRELEEVHRHGAQLLIEAKERGLRDADRHLVTVRDEVRDLTERRRREIGELQTCTSGELEARHEEFAALIERALWGERAA